MPHELYLTTHPNPDGTVTPFLSSQPFLDKDLPKNILPDSKDSNLSGALWMLATLAVRKQLDNPAKNAALLTKKEMGNLEQLHETRLIQFKPLRSFGRLPTTPTSRGEYHPAPINLLCSDILLHILEYAFGVSDKRINIPTGQIIENAPHISRLSHYSQVALFQFTHCLSDTMLDNLIHAVTEADEATAEWIIAKNPAYLLLKNSEGITAFQKALQTNDDDMCMMMENYFKKLQNGLDAMKQQFNEIFPQGYEAHLKKQKKEANDLFDNIHFDSAEALHAFKTRYETYIKNSTTHNSFILQKAVEIYEMWSPHNWDRLASSSHQLLAHFHSHLLNAPEEYLVLFSRQVIGFIQERSSKVWKQHYAEGLYDIPNKAKKRSFILKSSNDIRSLDGLGTTLYINGVAEIKHYDRLEYYHGGLHKSLSNLCEQKHETFKHYAPPEPKRNCVAM